MGDRRQATEFFNRAVIAVNDKTNPAHLIMAYQNFASAALADESWGMAWYQLGNNNSDLEERHGVSVQYAAIADYHKALACSMPDDERAKVYANMSNLYRVLGRTAEAVLHNDWAQSYDDKLPTVWMNKSLCASQNWQHRYAVEHARKALALEPTNLDFKMVLAFALLFAGQYREGFELFETRFQWRLQHYLHFPYPKWEGQDVKNATILISADQGLGDTLSFARFIPLAAGRCKKVFLFVQPALIRPFVYMFAHLKNVEILPMNSPFPPADAWTTFVSLPYVLKLTDEQVREQKLETPIPTFVGPTNWKNPNRKFHIGVAWSGSARNPIDKHRNFPLHQLFELYRVPEIQLYSLQVDGAKEQLGASGGAGLITDMSAYIGDVSDTASILRHLDLVITCESALGHICSAVGKECWIPYSYLGRDYRAGLAGEVKLWAPNHRFYQQGKDMSWEPVFESIIDDLKERVKP